MFSFSGRRVISRRDRQHHATLTAGIAAACVAVGVAGLGTAPAMARQSSPAAAAAVAANQAARSAVAMAIDGSGNGFAFYRGQSDAVYMRSFRDGVWSAQTSVGGVIVGAPAA